MTTEDKKLILKFMGVTPKLIAPDRYGLSDQPYFSCVCNTPEECLESYAKYSKYDTSWDWIMPVVEKIESLVLENDEFFAFNILGGCCVYIISSRGDEVVESSKGSSKLLCTYNAVVEFINFYNESNEQ